MKEFSSQYNGRGYCINVTRQIQSSGDRGKLFFLEFSHGSCLDPSAQFRFRENGAMLNLQRQGCLAAFHNASGYNLDMFYLHVDSVKDSCAQKPSESIYRAITQTSKGALSVYYKGKDKDSFETWCIYYQYYYPERFYYIGLNTGCNYRLIFGKIILNIFLQIKNYK